MGDWFVSISIHSGEEKQLYTGRTIVFINESPTNPSRVQPFSDANRIYFQNEELRVYLNSNQTLDPNFTELEIPYDEII